MSLGPEQLRHARTAPELQQSRLHLSSFCGLNFGTAPCGGDVLHSCLKMSRTKRPM